MVRVRRFSTYLMPRQRMHTSKNLRDTRGMHMHTLMQFQEIRLTLWRGKILNVKSRLDMSEVFWKEFTCGRSSDNKDHREEARKEWEQFIGHWIGPSGVMDCTLIWIAYFCAWVVFKDMRVRILRAHRPVASDESVQLSYGRSMFITNDRYIGLGPRNVEKGDCLALLEGGRVPYVLRRKGEAYELIGDC
ncbi:hypothetical protein BU16DRAFT_198797 [Lophium mytilinum]|uniref:Uncharacterized protein n=1 Tax=Lophium mytilinum TaxID=390894 RepID=A0A6A6R9B5_9PEZI|nr:hypothetical protein BU16DRAFT_198797 [Lophium mytilinum]